MVVLAVYGTTVVQAETVALWLFDDPPGSPVAVDSSGNAFHLTMGPDAAIVNSGKYGGALDADATEQDGLGAFRYRAESALNPGDENWTLECWVKARPGMQNDNRIWGLSGVNYIDYGRGDNPTGLYIASRYLPIDGVKAWNRPTGNLQADNRFHHFAVAYDANSKQLRHYFDGERQFTATGAWKDVPTGEAPYADVVMPPHYPMLQVGMRDAYQQWNHGEIHLHQRHMKKFRGFIDEMRFSNVALYNQNFTPPRSFAKPALRVWPERLDLVVVRNNSANSPGKGNISIHSSPQLKVNLPRPDTRITYKAADEWLQVSAPEVSGRSVVLPYSLRIGGQFLAGRPTRHESSIEIRADDLKNRTVPVSLSIVDRGDIRDVADHKQLFIDRRFIASSDNVELHTNAAQKIGTDFRGSHYPRNIVHLQDKRVWRMYFAPWSNLHCAESTDAIHWRRLPADTIGYESEEEPGKLLPLSFGAVVMLDRHDKPERRFKAFQEVTVHAIDADGYEIPSSDRSKPKRSLAGVYAFYSADGFRFRKAGRVMPVLPEFVSFAPQWDHNLGKYVCWFRCQNTKLSGLSSIQGNQFFYHYGFSYEKPEGFVTAVAPDTMGRPGFENLRSIARIETDDLLKPWLLPPDAERNTMYATSTTTPIVMATDFWDGFSDFYVHSTLVYPYAQNVYLMFPTVFRHFHPSRQPYFHAFDDANGPLETTLAVSRDGIHWDRVDRKAYVPMGRTDQWDRYRTMTGLGMARAGNDLYQFYWGGGDLHDSLPLRPEFKPNPAWHGGLGLVKQRLDGLVSADVDYRGGHITTPPIVFRGNWLELNHNCGGQGTIFVELRDLNDQPVPGYALADCEEVSCDDVAWKIRWRGCADVSSLAGRPIKIHFKMRNAKLYAFQFVGGDTARFVGPPTNLSRPISKPTDVAPAGMPIAVQSNGNIVVARKDRYVEIRQADKLSSRIAIVGRFGGAVAALAVLSDDAVVVAMGNGEIQVRSPDLVGLLAGVDSMVGPGDGIEDIAVDRKDRIVLKTKLGKVQIVTRALKEVLPAKQLVQP